MWAGWVGWARPAPPHPLSGPIQTFLWGLRGQAFGMQCDLSPTPIGLCRTLALRSSASPLSPLKRAHTSPVFRGGGFGGRGARAGPGTTLHFAPPAFLFPLGVWQGWSWLECERFPHQASEWALIAPGGWEGRGSTSIPRDVDLRRGSVPSRPRGPNLHQGMAVVVGNCDLYPVLAGEVERGGGV